VSIAAGQIERLPAKVPTIQGEFNAPSINVPFIGCFSGDGQTYIGRNFGNRPDILRLNHLRQKVKEYEQRIITMTIGQLDNPPRAEGFAEEIVRITADIATMVNAITETVAEVTEELQAGINFVNARMGELDQLRTGLQSIPEELRTRTEAKLIERYNQYFGELESQASRLETAMNCLGAV
jgi:hypothetical protein